MKQTMINNKKGFTIIELAVAMAIVVALAATMIPAFIASANKGNVTNVVSTVKALQTAGVSYYTANGGTYTGGTVGTISLANMISANANVLPGNSQGTGPWGGAITIQPDANANFFDVIVPNVPNAATATQLTSAVANFAQAAPVYTAANKTWQVAL